MKSVWKETRGKWYCPSSSWWDHPAVKLKLNEELSVKNKTHEHENTNSKINEKYLYELDKISLEENNEDWQKRVLKNEIKNL